MGLNIETKDKKQKTTSERKMEFVALLLIIFTIIGGTLAWQSFSQRIINETISDDSLIYEKGGRLHDYYDGTLKEVFIENYASAGYGEDIYARIRLDEYYEYGEGAGSTSADASKLTIVRGDQSNIQEHEEPSITKVETWDTYNWGSEAVEGTESIRTHRQLAFGGKTFYMPTFNKNIYSLVPEINGTYAGPDGNRDTDFDRYADYVKYEENSVSDETYVYYGDPLYPTGEYNLKEEETSVYKAKDTLSATVISMEEWMGPSYNEEVGPYWVYDTDGWAYWAQPIKWQSATGLLLNEIITVDKAVHSEWYYAVNVVAQIATVGDWGDEPEEDAVPGLGMYEGGFTEQGMNLLNTISEQVEE